ncbi:MAG: DNA repair protein RadC [Azospirillum sp.]|nr:DNA repair protein RadC [Azospirillum sp.]MCA3264723.1 DNA repair protein RadC [Azospirillum sp.]MCZ8124826.1 DNA repair protein RadC [Magnetospirillum sp.]
MSDDVPAPFDGVAEGPAPHYHGHRQRLRARFRRAGAAALEDYELLEMLLFAAIPRRDVKPLAKALIARFGGYAGALSAGRSELAEVEGLGETAIDALLAVREAAVRLARAEIAEKPVLSGWEKLMDYLMADMARAKQEHFRLLFLDKKNRLIHDEVHQSGTVDHAPVYPREVAKRCLELHASAVILVHNHPSGDTTPSRADIDITREIDKALKAIGVAVHDHVIVGRKGHTSFKAKGLF